jgi:ATP-binding cassette, subfamily B, bacterial MsbA
MKVLDRLLGSFVDPDGPLRPIAARHAWSIPVVGALSFIASLLEGFGIGFLIPLLSSLSTSASPTDSVFVGVLDAIAAVFPLEYRFVAVGAIMLLLVLCKGILQGTAEMIVSWVDGKVGHDIRTLLAKSYLSAGYSYFLAMGQARLLNAMHTESWRGSEVIRIGFQVVVSVATVIVFSLLLLLTQWQLFLVVVVGAGFIRLFQTVFSGHVARLSGAIQHANVDMARRMGLVGFEIVKLVRLFNQERQEGDRFEASSDRLRDALTRVARRSAWIGPISELLYALLFLGILIGAHASGIALPILLAFLIIMYRMQPHVRALATAGVSIAAVTASVREIEAVVSATTDHPPPVGTGPFTALNDGLTFEDVGFDYATKKGGETAFAPISFEIVAGRWVALTGPSGAGKSTVVNLICKLLSPTNGRILVDGVDLATIDTADWRAHLGVAGQDLDLFDGTIAENIGFGVEGATEAAIVEVARLVGLDAFVAVLPKGYETIVGERGLALSGGQRQRIGLARAVLRKPSLLILDEATNALDAASEAEIMRGLRDLGRQMTAIVISHRASTLAICDDRIELGETSVPNDLPAPAQAQV